MNADEWLPIRPGSYAALALGIAHVLVRDGLHDRDFVAAHCSGFESWKDEEGVEHVGLAAVLADHAPEAASARCGIPAATVERLAHELAASRPSFAVAGPDEL